MFSPKWIQSYVFEPILQRLKAYIITAQDRAILSGYFRYGYDRASLENKARVQYVITMPASGWNPYLFSRTLSAFNAGGIEYRVYTGVNLAGVNTTPAITRPPANAQVTWEKITDPAIDPIALGGEERDYTEIPKSGQGAQAVGGLLGSQDLRPQPDGAVFVIDVYNNSGVAGTNQVLTYLTWAELPEPEVL